MVKHGFGKTGAILVRRIRTYWCCTFRLNGPYQVAASGAPELLLPTATLLNHEERARGSTSRLE